MSKQEAICGNCVNFDLYRMKDLEDPDKPRELVGSITLGNGKEVKLGLCRAERGLKLGARTEISICGLVPSAFSPKETEAIDVFPNLHSAKNLKPNAFPGF